MDNKKYIFTVRKNLLLDLLWVIGNKTQRYEFEGVYSSFDTYHVGFVRYGKLKLVNSYITGSVKPTSHYHNDIMYLSKAM